MALALRRAAGALALAGLLGCEGSAPELVAGERRELVHPGAVHELHVSEPALAVTADGTPVLAFVRGAPGERHVFVARLSRDGPAAEPVRVDPPDAPLASSHQAPGLAAGGDGAVHVSWSTPMPRAPFGSELLLATSRDGGASFGLPRRVATGAPATRGFEGLAVDAAGTPFVAWIEIGGAGPPRTLLARVPSEPGAEPSVRELGRQTCPCCRVVVAAGDGLLGVLWRDEFPGQVRDMVLALSRDGGASFGQASRVHEDGWVLAGCPHRGGALGFDAAGRALAVWYTEGTRARPELRLAIAADGARFGPPRVLHDRPGSLPDHVALAMRPDGSGVVVWEAATPVRSEIVARAFAAGGARLGPSQVLSRVVKAHGPAVVTTRGSQILVAWNEEEFPTLRTVVQTLSLAEELP